MNELYYENNDRTYLVTTDLTPRCSKPIESEKKQITNNLTHVTGVTIEQFSTIVSQPFGYTWSGGIFNGTRSNKNWKSQSIFALDFDNGDISIEDVYNRFAVYDILPQLWYETFSSTEEMKKFRVVLFLDQPVVEISIHKLIFRSILSLFPEADKSCKDAGRYFFGGKQSTITSNDPISKIKLIDVLAINMITSDSNSLRKIPIDAKHFDQLKSAENPELLYTIYRSYGNSANISTTTTTSCTRGHKQRIDIDVARLNVKILDEFLNGTWLHHNQLFGLATNMLYVEGGLKLMKSTMMKFNTEGKTNYTDNNFNILPYINSLDYKPMPIYKFSPYKEDNGLMDLISETIEKRGQIDVLEPTKLIELEEAETMLQTKFKEVIEHGELGKIYLFSLPTAIGKTESYLSTKSTIALPTNELKNEIGKRMKIGYMTTPDRPVFDNQQINLQMEYYYRIGVPNKSMQILNSLTLTANSQKHTQRDIEKARDYIEKLRAATNATETIVTTHKRSIFTPFPHDTIIFDEDPLNSLLEIKELKISDVFKLYSQTSHRELLHIMDNLNKLTATEYWATPTFSILIDELIKNISFASIDSNIIDFLGSSYYVKDGFDTDKIYYIIKRELPTDKKVIILSASPSLFIYEKLYGERLEVIDIRNVKQMGSVRQYTKKSCSREGLKIYHQYISDMVGDTPALTFKNLGGYFKNPIESMYFGNCSGYDGMKGQDMAVIGTPHRNPYEYFLTAKALGIEFKATDASMTFQKIEHNGFGFKFNCFEHPELRKIQLSFIESDLIQAVGRARTLRTPANVDLYSNFPLSISERFIF